MKMFLTLSEISVRFAPVSVSPVAIVALVVLVS